MDTEADGAPPFFGTWKPSPEFEPGISLPNERSDEKIPSFFSPPYNGYRPGIGYQRQPYRSTARYQRNPNLGPFGRAGTLRDTYWSTTGPKLEARKMLGSTIELPLVAPAAAPPEDKKLILTQTAEKLAEAASGDWQAKTQQLAQRFVAAVPNSLNEAKVRLTRFKDFTCDVFDYGPSAGLQADFTPSADLVNTLDVRYLKFDIRVIPRNAPPEYITNPGFTRRVQHTSSP